MATKSIEPRRTRHFRWAVHIDCTDGAAYVVDGFVRLREERSSKGFALTELGDAPE
jgi:hypothetical protein